MNKLLHQLHASTDLISLHSAFHSICSEFGPIRSLDIRPARLRGQRKAVCFLRMDTIEHEAQVMRALDVGRFSDHLVIVVDLSTPASKLRSDTPIAGHV